MSKMNPKNNVRFAVKSFNGNPQELKGAEQQLYDIAVTSMFGKDTFYESNDVRLDRLSVAIDATVKKGNLDFIANTIVFARSTMNIRSMPVAMVVLFANSLRENNVQYPLLRTVVRDVIQRADQITDLIAFALSVFGSKNKIPLAVRRGVADSFNKFNEYTFAKYNRSNGIKFTDVMRIVHPKPANENMSVIFDKLMNECRPDDLKTPAGTLQIPYTWETQLSEAGKTGRNKTEVWSELVGSSKMGYMALIRNIRNMLDANVDQKVLSKVCDRLMDPEQVHKSKMLPFQFMSAFSAIDGSTGSSVNKNMMKNAVSVALDESLANMPKLGDNIWIIVDVSLSMRGGYGAIREGGPTPIQTATIFAAALAKANANAKNVVITTFSDSAKNARVDVNLSTMDAAAKLQQMVHGGGTNLEAALKQVSTLGFTPDTVVLFSDMQVNRLSKPDAVNKAVPKDAVRVAVDLNGYNTTPVGQLSGWWQLTGWSERLFDFVPALRQRSTVVKTLSVPYTSIPQ